VYRREQTEGRQRHRGKRPGMAEILLEFVSVVFQYIEALVLDCPARSAADDNLGDIVFRDGKAGHPGHGIFDLVLRVDNFEEISKPIQLISCPCRRVAERPRSAVTERLFRIATADFRLVTAELGSVDEVVERLVRSPLMKSSPASVPILATGWQANRSSPETRGPTARAARCAFRTSA
jgi:hypothetical protein